MHTSRGASKRVWPLLSLTALCFCAAARSQAQTEFVTPGPNTNLIGTTPDPANVPDFALKQQQEPSCIVRPTNAAYILCAYNDLRASDRPSIQGDAWIGVSMSGDSGQTWFSRFTPRYRGDTGALDVGFAADPGLVSIPGAPGLAVLNYIGAFRDRNEGVLAVQRWVEYPQEDIDFWRPEDAVYIIAEGSGAQGRFLDKPAFYYLLDEPSAQTTLTETVFVERDGVTEPVEINTPSGTLISAYAVFTGSSSSQVWIRTSRDNGRTWGMGTKLSEEQNEVTGVTVTGIGRTVVASWRRQGDVNNTNAIMTSFSRDGGARWSKGAVAFELCPFDQPATGSSFRTFAFPWLANDGKRFWVFAADRRFAGDASCVTLSVPAPPGSLSGVPRIVGMSSSDGRSWVGAKTAPAQPFIVDPQAYGMQFMPAAFGTKGRIDLGWYDTRREEQVRVAGGMSPLSPDVAVDFAYAHNYSGTLPLVYDYVDIYGSRVFRKADVYMTRLAASSDCSNTYCSPTIESSVRVTRFPFMLDAEDSSVGQEVEAHLPNLRLYASGTLAFKGDYIAVATPAHRQLASGAWIPNAWPKNAAGSELPGFVEQQDVFFAWGDNRDVRAGSVPADRLPYAPTSNSGFETARVGGDVEEEGELVAIADDDERTTLVAVTESDDDEAQTPDIVGCYPDPEFDYSRSRDSNIYGSLVADAPSLTSATTIKPLGTVQRMFPLELHNPETVAQTFCLDIPIQPPPSASLARASFYQLPATAPFDGAPPPLTRLDVEVPALSSASRAAFVVASSSAVVAVDAYLGACPIPGAPDPALRIGSVRLGNGELVDSEFCQELGTCLDVQSNETHDITLLSPGLQAPVLQAPSLQAPSLQAPVLQAPGLQAPSLQAPVLQAPSLQANPLLAPSLQAPSLQAPSLQAPSLQAETYQDISYVVSTDGNVTTTYSADIAVNGIDPDAVQLIAWTPNVYTTASDCLTQPTADQQVIAAVEVSDQGLASVTLPSTFTPEQQDPYVGEISFTGTPDKDIVLTVRIWASGQAADQLEALYDEYYEACVATDDPSGCDPMTAGVAGLISFGASAHSCSTNALPTDGNNTVDCLNNNNEKIFNDHVGPVISPPDGFIKKLEAESAAGVTISTPGGVPTFVTATDPSGPISLACESFDIELGDIDTLVPIGDHEITCSASDGLGNTSMATIGLAVHDTTAPSLTVENLSFTTLDSSLLVDYLAYVDATDFVGPVTLVCDVGADGTNDSSPYEFPLGVTAVECTATDGEDNSTSKSFTVTVKFRFDIQIVAPRGRITAGSTIPLDWRYFEGGVPVDSAGVSPIVRWRGRFTDPSCEIASPNVFDGDDAGSSGFRYSVATLTWQYSWQTPAMPGYYRFGVDPPGLEAASICVRLR